MKSERLRKRVEVWKMVRTTPRPDTFISLFDLDERLPLTPQNRKSPTGTILTYRVGETTKTRSLLGIFAFEQPTSIRNVFDWMFTGMLSARWKVLRCEVGPGLMIHRPAYPIEPGEVNVWSLTVLESLTLHNFYLQEVKGVRNGTH